MRKLLPIAVVMALAAAARATPMVTYTLSLNEAPTGEVAAGRFMIYATVSQGDNAGLFAFAIDLLGSNQAGGPAGLTLFNRSPDGTFDVDPADPNFNPADYYPQWFLGYTTGRGANASTGLISGVHDLCKGCLPTPIPIIGAGQVAMDLNSLRPPPDTSSAVPVRYGNYVPAAGTETLIGNPWNRAGLLEVREGSLRLATGIYDVGGVIPTFELASINNKASVWKVSHPTNTENELATLQLCIRDFSGVQSMEIVPGQSCVVVPEPAVLGLFLMPLVTVLARRARHSVLSFVSNID